MKLDNLAILAFLAGGRNVNLFAKEEPKPVRKCRLKDCTKSTSHNNGFCCREHYWKAYPKKKTYAPKPS